mgnify:CR=1 FL=1
MDIKNEDFKKIMELMPIGWEEKAKELNICVLFDPFRDLKISDQSIVRV